MLTRVSHMLLGSANLAKCWNSISRRRDGLNNDSGIMALVTVTVITLGVRSRLISSGDGYVDMFIYNTFQMKAL